MIEKVNPDHPDKLADRIAGALVDYAYEEQEAPRVAFEVLLGHGEVNIIGESSVYVPKRVAKQIITRILKHEDYNLNMNIVEQDVRLAANQAEEPRAGGNKRKELSCAIGDNEIDGVPYKDIVQIAKEYIDEIGGFERLAEWGLS